MAIVDVFFVDHKETIFDEIKLAKSSVKIAVAWINFSEYFPLFDSLLDNHIELKIICSDNIQNRAHNIKIKALISKGAKIKLLKMPSVNNHMHHKFAIIDNETVLNGSFNWSPNAVKSFENIMVIKDSRDLVTKFKVEFDRIFKIKPTTIKDLQKKKRCPEDGCKGHLYNILVFSERSTKYDDTYGDIISICDNCEEYQKLEECLNDPQIKKYIEELHFCDDDWEFENKYTMLTEHMEQYQNNNPIIHAIGQVSSYLDGYDDDCVKTVVLWKNNFVGNHIQDEYDDEDFDVLYDN
jgi:phosphatidylserine/phosphatidylglycerophosphate/cardiolipin synthase-like enzyme